MKTFANEKGLKLKPCLNSVDLFCPCNNHSGEIQMIKGNMVLFRCENRKMHKIKKDK